MQSTNRLRKNILVALSTILLLGGACLCQAEETSKTLLEQLQDAQTTTVSDDKEEDLDVDAVDDEAENDDSETNDLAKAWENLSAAQIVTGIKDLDLDELDAWKVKAIRKSYDKLTNVDKAHVNNIDKLIEAEERLPDEESGEEGSVDIQEKNSANATTSTNVEGKTYSFEIDDFKSQSKQFSLILYYTTDDNNDGVGDTPVVSITSPDNVKTALTEKMSEYSDKKSHIMFTWEKNYMQLDLQYGMEGTWTITTSIPVTFSRTDYRGPKSEPKSVEDEMAELELESERFIPAAAQPIAPAATFSPIIQFALLVASLALFMFVVKTLAKKIWSKSPKGDLTSGANRTADVVDKDAEIKRQMEDIFRQQEENQRKEQEEKEKANKGQKTDPQNDTPRDQAEDGYYEDADDLAESNIAVDENLQEQIDNNGGITESDMHVGDTDILNEEQQSKPSKPKVGSRFSR